MPGQKKQAIKADAPEHVEEGAKAAVPEKKAAPERKRTAPQKKGPAPEKKETVPERKEAVPEKKEENKEEAAAPLRRKKVKPSLDDEMRAALEARKERTAVQPAFRRHEWFRYKKLGEKWRRPRAITNKQRINRKYRPAKVRVGYGKPALTRGLHPSGFREVLIFNLKDLERIDPSIEAARIGATVGTRTRRTILEAADAKGIRILNRGVL